MSSDRFALVLRGSSAAKALAKLEADARDLSPAMHDIGEMLLSSAQRNFEVGGRFDRAGSIFGGPNTWQKKKDGSASKLLRHGTLRDSLHVESDSHSATVGTNMEYAAIHNFGGELKSYARSELFTRNRAGAGSIASHPNLNPFAPGTSTGRGQTYGESSRKMPARPFLVVQDGNIQEAKQFLRAHLLGGVK